MNLLYVHLNERSSNLMKSLTNMQQSNMNMEEVVHKNYYNDYEESTPVPHKYETNGTLINGNDNMIGDRLPASSATVYSDHADDDWYLINERQCEKHHKDLYSKEKMTCHKNSSVSAVAAECSINCFVDLAFVSINKQPRICDTSKESVTTVSKSTKPLTFLDTDEKVGGERVMVDQVEYDYEENNHEENILPSIVYNSHPVIEEVTKNSVTSHQRIVKIDVCPLHEEWDTKISLRNVPQEINLERKYTISGKISQIEEKKEFPTGTQIVYSQQDHGEIKTLLVSEVFKEPDIPLKTIKKKSFLEEQEEDIQMIDDEFCRNEIYSHDERKDINQGWKSLKRKSLSSTYSLMVLMFTMLLQSSIVLGGIVYTKPGQLCSHCNSNKGHLFLETDEREDSYNRFLLPENYQIQLSLLKVNSEITVVLTISLIGDMQLAMSYLLQIDDIQRRLQNMKSEIVVILSITPIGDMPLSTSYFPLTNDKQDEDLDNTLVNTEDRNTYLDINQRKLSLNMLEFEKHSLLGLNYGILGNKTKKRKLSMFEDEKHSLFQLNDWISGNEKTYLRKKRAFRSAYDFSINSFSKTEQKATRNVAYMKSVGYQHIDLYSIDDWLRSILDSDFHTEGNKTNNDDENDQKPNYRLDSRYADSYFNDVAMKNYDCKFETSIKQYNMVLMSDLKSLNVDGVKRKSYKKELRKNESQSESLPTCIDQVEAIVILCVLIFIIITWVAVLMNIADFWLFEAMLPLPLICYGVNYYVVMLERYVGKKANKTEDYFEKIWLFMMWFTILESEVMFMIKCICGKGNILLDVTQGVFGTILLYISSVWILILLKEDIIWLLDTFHVAVRRLIFIAEKFLIFNRGLYNLVIDTIQAIMSTSLEKRCAKCGYNDFKDVVESSSKEKRIDTKKNLDNLQKENEQLATVKGVEVIEGTFELKEKKCINSNETEKIKKSSSNTTDDIDDYCSCSEYADLQQEMPHNDSQNLETQAIGIFKQENDTFTSSNYDQNSLCEETEKAHNTDVNGEENTCADMLNTDKDQMCSSLNNFNSDAQSCSILPQKQTFDTSFVRSRKSLHSNLEVENNLNICLKTKKENQDETVPKSSTFGEENNTEDIDQPPELSLDEFSDDEEIHDDCQSNSIYYTSNGNVVQMCSDDFQSLRSNSVCTSIEISRSSELEIVKELRKNDKPKVWNEMLGGISVPTVECHDSDESFTKSYVSGKSLESDSLKSEKFQSSLRSSSDSFVRQCSVQRPNHVVNYVSVANLSGYVAPSKEFTGKKSSIISLQEKQEKKSSFKSCTCTEKIVFLKSNDNEAPKCGKAEQQKKERVIKRNLNKFFEHAGRRRHRSVKRILRRTIGHHRKVKYTDIEICPALNPVTRFPAGTDIGTDNSETETRQQNHTVGGANVASMNIFRPPTTSFEPPNKTSLQPYFTRVLNGADVTSEEKMQYEMLRVQSFQDLPASCPVSPLKMAKTGFFSSGQNGEVTCFSCDVRYKNWKNFDNPQEVHRRISPACSMVNGRESRNVPVSPQQNGIIYSENQETLANVAITNEFQSQANQDGGSSIQTNGYVSHQSDIQTRHQISNNNVADSTSRQQQPYAVQEAMRQPAEVQQTIRPPSVDRAHSVLEGEQNRPAHRDMAEDLGITLERPKYPAYAQLSVRVSTFQGWPGYLDQAPRDMALAGFFYAGYNDYCRCFFCGGGLRNWDAGDDPWVEHARWFSKCPFVRQNRGHRFVEIIVKRQAEMQASGASGSAKNQTAVTTQSEIEARTQVTSQETTETQTTQSETASSNRDPATESVRDMGYTDEMIKRAIDNIKQNNPGKEKIEATEILEMIFTIADDDTTTQTNTAVVSENTPSSAFGSSQASIQPSVRTTTSEAQTATSSVPASTSESSLPSLSVSSLEVANAAASGGKHQQSSASKEITENEIRSLQEENIQLKEQVMCKICMDKNVSIAFLPCGHLACCIDCAPAMRKCPMCRVYIKGTVKTYLA